MTQEQKEQIVAEILAAYVDTRLPPSTGTWLDFFGRHGDEQSAPQCGCAQGAAFFAADKTLGVFKEAGREDYDQGFAALLGMSYSHARGIRDGFDGQVDYGAPRECDNLEYYDGREIGEAVRAIVFNDHSDDYREHGSLLSATPYEG